MNAADAPAAWRHTGVGVGSRPEGPGWRTTVRRAWPLLVWAALLLPSLRYYLVGTIPAAAWMQDLLMFAWVVPLVAITATAGLLWICWQLARAVRSLPEALRHASGEVAARPQLRIAAGTGAVGLGALSLYALLTGTRPDQPLVSNAHMLDAISDALLIAGLVLLLAAFIFFPPMGVVAVAGGGVVLVPTLTAGFVTLGALGLSGIMLSQAAANAGGDAAGGSGGGSGGSSGSGGGPPPRLTGNQITSWGRARAPSLVRRWPMCVFTVAMLTCRWLVISAFDNPCATRVSTSRSCPSGRPGRVTAAGQATAGGRTRR